ncbi:hypothetical protein [Edaphobacter modestus]|uniref:Uncharacterized protein n=1 Tax=Edaphobacter modestus TaxID=388466 RepID=A0A4Q7XZA6_9BACT|nr:hypothetical protein [Edaphobacter modestus]RZU29762.1 hypothetical protein BDD14_6380 [Edaphobacter modestus]
MGLIGQARVYPNLNPSAAVPVDRDQIFSLSSFADNYRMRRGKEHGQYVPNARFTFVKLTSGETLMHQRFRHPVLAEGRPVLYAGEAYFNNGKLDWWSNGSGNYRPDADHAEQAGLPVDQFFTHDQIMKGAHRQAKLQAFQTGQPSESALQAIGNTMRAYGAPPVYRPQTTLPLQGKMKAPSVFQPAMGRDRRAGSVQINPSSPIQDRMGAPLMYRPVAAAPVQGKHAVVARQLPPFAVQSRLGLIQAKVQLKGGAIVGPSTGSATAVKLLDKLQNDLQCTTHGSRYKRAKELIGDAKTFEFEGFKHFSDFVHDPDDIEPPSIRVDNDLAEAVDDWAMDLGDEFKGKHIPFSGSRVFAVSYSQGDMTLNVMQNGATGYVAKAKQSVVKLWEPPVTGMEYSFPSNTKAMVGKIGKVRPTLLASNAHAEVNEYIQHAIFSHLNGHTPHDVNLAVGSDIAHCAECWWAAWAMITKKGGTFVSSSKCENKLFERWREPWVGFYTAYGANPFRDGTGKLKSGLTKGVNLAYVLNSKVGTNIYG